MDGQTLRDKPLDKKGLLEKYLAERDKRLRDDGNDQYLDLEGAFAHYATDPYTRFVEREPVFDHVTFAFVGAGFAGLVTGARLAEAGITDYRLIEKGGDVGGTWYWNRYPGAQCDTASMIYLPLLEETGHMPTEKYVHGPEILAQCQRIAGQYGLYDKALFHTQIASLNWDEGRSLWVVSTDRGDRFTAKYIGLGTGPIHIPKLPGIPGIEDFKGHSFHTSRWDYGYTGGNAAGAKLDKLADKRVAIIGTGATAVQIVPHLARAAKELYVVQRTPSSVDVRDNAPIDPDWFTEIATPGWQQRWLENFTANQTPGFMIDEDLVQDGWTDISRRIKERVAMLPPDQRSFEQILAVWEDADFEKMNEIRARVDTIVEDLEAAENLKAWYRQLCKRPCFHDQYLQAFNQPGTHLIDTDGKGVEKITAKGFVVAGREYEVDCIVYASGFRVGANLSALVAFDVVGRGGLKLSDAWGDGMRSLHGIHVHDFPNMFVVTPAQGANLISNVPHNLTASGRTIAAVVARAEEIGAKEVEVSREAQDEWVALLLTGSARSLRTAPDCTPGYYNNEGKDSGPAAAYAVGYPLGAHAYFKYLGDWTMSGKFDGIEFR
ncbi:MAG: NAD(P)/FAD-dependent oxidoreductase [Candidatus Sphingomonas colombiensis]|nr:NAD(P)/FAD-dependent oxidoreductase [Sphingomonas sp.]WEK42354.1 MAG: NAD(P)/FAD-dependent oxidoreductase [Sphingomonas sp.]